MGIKGKENKKKHAILTSLLKKNLQMLYSTNREEYLGHVWFYKEMAANLTKIKLKEQHINGPFQVKKILSKHSSCKRMCMVRLRTSFE